MFCWAIKSIQFCNTQTSLLIICNNGRNVATIKCDDRVNFFAIHSFLSFMRLCNKSKYNLLGQNKIFFMNENIFLNRKREVHLHIISVDKRRKSTGEPSIIIGWHCITSAYCYFGALLPILQETTLSEKINVVVWWQLNREWIEAAHFISFPCSITMIIFWMISSDNNNLCILVVIDPTYCSIKQ